MFEYIRTHQRLMQLLLLIIIFPSFAFFGIESFTRSNGADNTVAMVAGQAITKQEFDNAQRNQLDRLRQAYGPQIDQQILNTPEVKTETLNELIKRKTVLLEVTKNHLTVSRSVLQKNIFSTPGLLKADGTFDEERYKSFLVAQGLTATSHQNRISQELSAEQLLGAVQNTAFTPKTVLNRVGDIIEQERDVQSLNFKAADYLAQVKITDEMLRAYYEKNGAQFEVPEQIKAEYVVLDNEAIAAQITVSDDELKTVYEANKKQYSSDEQRRASHILLNLKKDADAAEQKRVKDKAEAILAELKKKPESFAKLAKENSQDPGSAERGGDLDFFGKGAMVKPFEEAVNKLKEGEISGLVQSDFGIHIIQLTGIKPAGIKPFDEVKGQIAAEIKRQKAGKAYSEAADTFTNTVFEQSDNLKAVADKLKLKIETVASLSRKPNPALPPTLPTNNEKFLKAIFSEDSLKKKHNTEAVEVAPNMLVAGRVVDYKAASKRAFEEVKPSIEAAVKALETAKMAKAAGEQKLKDLKAKDDVAGFSEVKTVSRLKNQELPSNVVLAVMKADAQNLPAFVGLEAPGVGYSVYRIAKVSAGAVDQARRTSEKPQIENVVAQQAVHSYLEALKRKSKVKIVQAGFEETSVKP
ncbi:MAG: SurA N-terminal domain-containing protein [Burkholderiaceae bacterium]|nr:SurA N-terminal domain-containing protein [Burkholderiaceae bacterium]